MKILRDDIAMPNSEMNMSPAQFGNTGNPVASIANRMGGGRGGFGKMMIQHSLNKDLITHQYGEQKGLETHVGEIQSNLSNLESQNKIKEMKAGQRHEQRMSIITHNQSLEKAAQDHHLATDLVGTIARHAEGGTDVAVKTVGGAQASFTKKKKKLKQPPQAAAVEATPTASSEPKPLVGRDPKTGKIKSLKNKA